MLRCFAVVEVFVKEPGCACYEGGEYGVAYRAEIWLDRLPVLTQLETQER